MAPIGDWLTSREAAQETGYNVEHIRRLVRTGRLKAQKLGRDWVIDRASLLEYLRTEGHGPQVHKGLDRL